MSECKPYVRGALVLALVLVAGCVGSPEPPGDPHGARGRELLAEGVAAFAQGDYDAAAVRFDGALAHYQGLDDAPGMLASRVNLAEVALATGDLQAAERHLDAARALPAAGTDPLGHRVTLLAGALACRQAALERCESLLEQVLEEAPPDSGVHRAALANRTRLAMTRGDQDASLWLGRFRTAVGASPAPDPVMLGRLARFEAQAAAAAGQHDRAESWLGEAHGHYRAAGYRRGIAATLEQWAALAVARERWTEAEDLLTRALLVRLYLSDRDGSVDVLERLARVRADAGDAPGAARARRWATAVSDADAGEWTRLRERMEPL